LVGEEEGVLQEDRLLSAESFPKSCQTPPNSENSRISGDYLVGEEEGVLQEDVGARARFLVLCQTDRDKVPRLVRRFRV